jgi:RNA polymerase sigma factor (TIGR02999 family)
MMSADDSPRSVDPGATEHPADQLLPLVYTELRKLAQQRLQQEPAGQTLQATALVHEAYLRLLGPAGKDAGGWEGRGHFFSAAAEAMRRILVDRARARGAAKRGGGYQRLDLNTSKLSIDEVPAELLDLDAALDRLAAEAPQKADLVKLRFFAGLTLPQAAELLNISITTANRHWAYARAWLHAAMQAKL